MLVQTVRQACDGIARLDVERDADAFLRELQGRCPDLSARAFPDALQEMPRERSLGILARIALAAIKAIPTVARQMLDQLYSPQTDPAVRCAIITVLAYLVQPRDIIPDTAPGGYGYLDDAIVLHAGAMNLAALGLSDAPAEDHRQVLMLLTALVPTADLPALQRSVSGMEQSLHYFRMLPGEVLDQLASMMLTNPLAFAQPTEGGGHLMASVYLSQQARVEAPTRAWQDGGTTVVTWEGGGVAVDAAGVRAY